MGRRHVKPSAVPKLVDELRTLGVDFRTRPGHLSRQPKQMLTEEKSLKNLEIIALFTHHEVVDALSANLITWVADHFFAQNPGQFRTNPANTMTYVALAALEGRCVVRVAETLRDEHNLHRTSVPIRRKWDLINHRDALSHTGTVRWRKREMQEFTDAGRHWDDVRPALLWDMDRSVTEALVANGRRPPDGDLIATTEMARLLHLILDASRETSIGVPDPPALGGFLASNTARYVQILEKYPDGQLR
jgi:hypothetical protein